MQVCGTPDPPALVTAHTLTQFLQMLDSDQGFATAGRLVGRSWHIA